MWVLSERRMWSQLLRKGFFEGQRCPMGKEEEEMKEMLSGF